MIGKPLGPHWEAPRSLTEAARLASLLHEAADALFCTEAGIDDRHVTQPVPRDVLLESAEGGWIRLEPDDARLWVDRFEVQNGDADVASTVDDQRILPLNLEVVHAVREDVAALVVETRALGDSELVSREPYERLRSRPDRLAEPGEPQLIPGSLCPFRKYQRAARTPGGTKRLGLPPAVMNRRSGATKPTALLPAALSSPSWPLTARHVLMLVGLMAGAEPDVLPTAPAISEGAKTRH
jgi:hypothetical protein